MLIGSFGRFWDRDLVDWDVRAWRLLGRRGLNKGTIKVADFRRARGVYVLYNEVGVYYVGLAMGEKGLGGRLRDHLRDEHGDGWTRFSWFAFDGVTDLPDGDGVYGIDQYDSVELDSAVPIRDLEALLQIAIQPFANLRETRFGDALEWTQVATKSLDVWTFKDLQERLT